MSETIVNLNSIQDILFKLFQTRTVRIREENGVVTIIPIIDENTDEDCPLYGLLKDNGKLPNGVLASDEFSKQKQIEKGLEL